MREKVLFASKAPISTLLQIEFLLFWRRRKWRISNKTKKMTSKIPFLSLCIKKKTNYKINSEYSFISIICFKLRYFQVYGDFSHSYICPLREPHTNPIIWNVTNFWKSFFTFFFSSFETLWYIVTSFSSCCKKKIKKNREKHVSNALLIP